MEKRLPEAIKANTSRSGEGSSYINLFPIRHSDGRVHLHAQGPDVP